MGLILLAAFIGVPLLEIAVFIQVGEVIGLWPTLGAVVLTAVIGTWCLRAQGLATLARARAQIDRGALPTRELFDGACLLVAGALLLTPGFVTDTVGFLLFLPPVREALRGVLSRYVEGRMESRVYVDGEEVQRAGPGSPRRGRGPVIEGEYDEIEDPEDPPRPGGGQPGGRIGGRIGGRRLRP